MAVRSAGHPYRAGIDVDGYPTLTALSGTAGTADTTGTAEIFALGGNPTTGGLYVHDINAGSGTILAGTIDILPLSGAVLTTAVAVANGTATALPTTILTNRKSFIAYNNGTTPLYLGGTGITRASNAILVGTGDFSPAVDLGTASIYGVGTSAGGTMIVMEVS